MELYIYAQVARKNWDADEGFNFILHPIEVQCSTPLDFESEIADRIADYKIYVNFESNRSGLKRFRMRDLNLQGFIGAGLFDEKRGGVLVSSSGNDIYATLILGTEENAQWDEALEKSLSHEHLYVAFCLPMNLSVSDDNSMVVRPVSVESFKRGVPLCSPGLPAPSLARRHIP